MGYSIQKILQRYKYLPDLWACLLVLPIPFAYICFFSGQVNILLIISIVSKVYGLIWDTEEFWVIRRVWYFALQFLIRKELKSRRERRQGNKGLYWHIGKSISGTVLETPELYWCPHYAKSNSELRSWL